jgi:large subunit ribosomal protein L9
MEVILLENIANLGKLGDTVNVKAGYGRNFLVPQAKAVAATSENVKIVESRKAELLKEAGDQLSRAEQRKVEIEAVTVTVSANVGEEGKLFGSVTVREIADKVTEMGVEVDRSEVRLPDGPLRNVGEYDVEIALHIGVNASLKVIVEAEESFPS